MAHSLENRHVSLDALRIGAALLVLAEHVRASIFEPFETLDANRLLLAPFYALTSMGHQAVMIFFALSGYLVGGHVLRRLLEGRWSLTDYTIKRMTRLWIVILPALAATFLVDHISMSLGNAALYDGSYTGNIVPSLPSTAEPADYGGLTFLGNFLFLQTISVPVYGSNGPLWSLAYEFWYYVMFPPLAWALVGSGRLSLRVIAIAGVLTLAALLPPTIVKLSAIWIAGALSSMAAGVFERKTIRWSNWLGPAGFAAIIVSALLSVATTTIDDLTLGLIVAVSLPAIASLKCKSEMLHTASAFGAEMSYSLYLFHFPVAVALAGILTLPERLQPSLIAFAAFVGIATTTILISAILWYAFERRTHAFYQFSCGLLQNKGWHRGDR